MINHQWTSYAVFSKNWHKQEWLDIGQKTIKTNKINNLLDIKKKQKKLVHPKAIYNPIIVGRRSAEQLTVAYLPDGTYSIWPGLEVDRQLISTASAIQAYVRVLIPLERLTPEKKQEIEKLAAKSKQLDLEQHDLEQFLYNKYGQPQENASEFEQLIALKKKKERMDSYRKGILISAANDLALLPANHHLTIHFQSAAPSS